MKGDSFATYLLVQACQHLWLVTYHDIYQQFTFISHTTQPSILSALMLADNLPVSQHSDSLTAESHCPDSFTPNHY
jgi:hypothetical protein